MPEIPVYCDNCDLVYGSGFFIENSFNVSLKNNRASCPKCRKLNFLPEGLFNFINGSIELINGTDLTLEKLRRIKKKLVEISKLDLESEEVKKRIDEDTPELNSLIGVLPKTRSELYNFMLVLIALITMCIDSFKGESKQPIEYNQFINNYNYTIQTTNNNIESDTIKSNKKIQRNEPCPCGSGKKFKYCHGSNQ